MKKLFSVVFAIISLIVFSKTIHAQGSNSGLFFCVWAVDSCIVNTSISDDTCNYAGGASNSNQQFCLQFSEEACADAVGQCSTCNSPSECLSGGCSGDYTDAPFGTCPNTADSCCILSSVTPPPPDVCYRCIIEPFSGNYCAAINPTNGSCDPNWADEQQCNTDCEQADSFTVFTCDRNSEPRCFPSATGNYTGDEAYQNCLDDCYDTPPEPTSPALCADGESIDTAIGCVPVRSNTAFAGALLQLGVGIGGGLGLVLIAVAAIMIQNSKGDPRHLKTGQDLLVGAIAGILLMILATVLLQIIGVNILGLPGFAA